MNKAGKKERYVLGIDQGGTKTAAAVIREDGFIVGRAMTKGAYFPSDGVERAMAPIEEAVSEAARSAGISTGDIVYGVAGISGVDWPGDDERIRKALQQKLSMEDVFTYNDMVIAFYSGARRPHGAVICAGTGMNGALIDRNGRQFVYGDYMEERAQGGSALAKRALRKVFDAELGLCPPTKLTPLFLQQAGLTDVDALLKRYMTEKGFQKELRFLMPQILMVARMGDEAAGSLLDEFAGEIVAYIEAGFRKMEMTPGEEDIVLAGSIFKGADNPLTNRVIEGVRERMQGAQVVQARYEPVVGACIMGLDRLGMEPSKWEVGIQKSAAVLGLLRS